MDKPRVIKEYGKLPESLQEQLKLVYPKGFSRHLIPYTNAAGERHYGLPLETEDHYYLVRMTAERAKEIVREDNDYDDDGRLKRKVKDKYEDKYDDVDYLSEYNSNDDNDLESESEASEPYEDPAEIE